MQMRSWFIGMMLLASALACNAPGQVPVTPTEAATAQIILITATPPPITAAPTAAPASATPAAPSGPSFGPEIRFSTEPNPATATRTFKKGVKRIYGMWAYSGMTAGLNIRREWYVNDTLWTKRELAWDMNKYGASGTITDVSIFDEEKGLPEGNWEVRLYIDDKPQFTGPSDIDFRSFTVGQAGGSGPSGPEGGTVLSPDGKMSATVENKGTLTVVDGQGKKKVIVTVQEIDGFAWMPDSRHIVYSTITSDGSGPFGTSYDLFIADVSSAGTKQLSNPKENLHVPVVSPTGKYIALFKGTGYGDACGVDLSIAIMEIDPAAMARVSLITQEDFTGMPKPFEDIYPDFHNPGVWQGPTSFKFTASYTCTEDRSNDGFYVVDVLTRAATRAGDLPKPQ